MSINAYSDANPAPFHKHEEARFRRIEKLLGIQNGHLVDTPDPTLYDDFLFSGLTFVGQGATSPTLQTFRDNVKGAAFAGTGGSTEEGFFNIHLTHGLKAGTALNLHIHWSHNAASPSGDVKWYVDYMIARGYQVATFGAATTLSVVSTPATQYEHIITDDDSMIIPAGDEVEVDAIVKGRIYRDPTDAADTFNDYAFLDHIDIHHQIGQFATNERNRPFTNEGF